MASARHAKTEITGEMVDYMVAHGARQDEVLERVERETAQLPNAQMQVTPDQGALLGVLVRATGARRVLEVGTFTGYSAICIARALPPDGSLLCLELSDEYADIASANLDAAGVRERVEIRRGPAAESLRELPAEPVYDFAFVDADKPGYPAYYELVLARLRPGGLMLLDNMLYGGDVLHPESDGARALDELNRSIAADERVDCALAGLADGVMLAVKR